MERVDEESALTKLAAFYAAMMLSLQSPGEEVSVKLVDPAGADVVAAGSLDAVEARLREEWHLGPRVAGGGGGGVQV